MRAPANQIPQNCTKKRREVRAGSARLTHLAWRKEGCPRRFGRAAVSAWAAGLKREAARVLFPVCATCGGKTENCEKGSRGYGGGGGIEFYK